MIDSKNNRRGKKPSVPTLNDHMDRLPLNQQLSCSQRMLIKLSSGWRHWLHDNLTDGLANSAVLSHYSEGKLLISCNSAAVASQIKHLQNTLIGHFNQTGFKEVHTISLRIEHPNQADTDGLSQQGEDTLNQAGSYCQPSSNSLKSISHCRQSIRSEPLSAALQRLEQTLKNN